MKVATEIEYICLTDWLEIQYKEADEDMKDYLIQEDWIQPCVEYESETYWLSDFVRTHNNPWGNIDCPDYIHGYDSTNIFNPMFIELADSGDCARLYKHKAKEWDSMTINLAKKTITKRALIHPKRGKTVVKLPKVDIRKK